MTDSTPDPPELDPAVLAGTSFTRVRKGFEPTEVHSLLGRTADALRLWQERDERLVERVRELESALERSSELDEQRITTVLGEETARIVKAARDAAAEIRANAVADAERTVTEAESSAAATLAAATAEAAELRQVATSERDDALAESGRVRAEAIEEAARMRQEAADSAAAVTEEARADAERRLQEAEERSTRLREEAQSLHDDMVGRAGSVLEERTVEAEAVAAGIRETADAELAAARSEGERIRTEARDTAAEEVDRARQEGREMVAEARRVRERMLRDLAERRRTARRQIEAARAARDRVVEALRATGDTVEDAVTDLGRTDEEADRAGDAAAAAVDDDIDHVVAELETGLGAGSFEPSDPLGPAAHGTEVPEPEVPEAAVLEAEVLEAGALEPDEEPSANGVGHPSGTEELAPVTELGVAAEQDDEPPGDQDEPSPGATVHDLFERIRAERAEARAAGDGGPEGASIDLTTATATVTVATGVPVHERAGTVPPEDDDAVAVAASAGDPAVTVDPTTALLDRRDQLLAPAEKSIARSLKRLVSDEQNEVLDRLRRIKRGRPELDVLLPPGADVEHFVGSLGGDFSSAVAAGEMFWNEAVGDGDVSPAPVDGPFPVLDRLVDELLANRRAHVQRVLEQADAEGLELGEVGDHVRAAYREWRSISIPELAGDLATAGFAEGARRAAGPDGRWCWIPDNGGLPCADAEDNALAGDLGVGEEFPTGDLLPPAHSGCRCILAPLRR
jgi:hypothetical protein